MSMFEDQRKETEGHDENGNFLPGNKFWRNRLRSGPKPMFETPDDLRDACFEYFDWADDNPLWEMKVFGTGLVAKVQHPRAMTVKGMCGHIGITIKTWREYRKKEEFEDLCETVENIIYEQKFAGAAAGLFSGTIIARDLGLTDKQEVDENLTIEVVDRFGEDNDSE